jgi:ketosteroid isomerase-like protein
MSIAPKSEDATATFEEFVSAINSHDVEALALLMTPDHLFVDSLGKHIQGAETMRSGWRAYFAMCPDYAISIGKILTQSDSVLATGESSGTIDNTAWRTPAAWQATIRSGQIAEWRVFADNKPVYDILARRVG